MNKIFETLNLTVPLVTLDLETTDLSVDKAKIVEIFALKVNPDGSREEFYSLVNPGIAIPPDAYNVHKIDNAMVADKPYFKEIAPGLNTFIGDAALLGFNSNAYDLPILVKEFSDAGIMFNFINRVKIDARVIHQRFNPSNLAFVYNHYTGKTLENAHTAEADVTATYEIFEEQVTRYGKEFPEDLNRFCNHDQTFLDLNGKFILKNGIVYFNFGKNKGIPALDDKSYLNWVLYTSDMRSDVKLIAKLLLDGKKFS